MLTASGSVRRTLLLPLAAVLAGCSTSGTSGGALPTAGPSDEKHVGRIHGLLLADGELLFDGREPATLACAALAPSACHAEAMAAWAADGGLASERRALAMLHQACLRGFQPSCAQIHTPLVLERRFPDYPAEAIRKGIQGEVGFLCTLSAEGGLPTNCRLVETIPELDALVLETLLATHFAPATFFGRPVQVDDFFAMGFEMKTTISR